MNYIVTAYPKIFEEISNNDNILDINSSQLNDFSSEELPQTGMLIWPIPILAFVGLIFFVIGYFLYVK